MNVTKTYNTWNVGVKHDILDMKNEFIKSLDGLKSDMCSKFANINDQLSVVGKHGRFSV